MAFVIPAVVSFVAAGGTAAAVGAALTGAAGFATFATVAGGFITSAGMLTKNKTLTKIGGIMSLVGGVTNLASSAMEKFGEAAVNSAADDALAASAADKVAKDAVTESLVSEMASKPVGGLAADAASTAGGVQPLELAAHEVAAGGVPSNPMDAARTAQAQTANALPTASGVSQPLAEAGQQIKNASALDNIIAGAKGVGKFVSDNKELVKLGGDMLSGGMQSAQRADELEQQMNLLEARRRRMNQVVQMGNTQPAIGIASPTTRLPNMTRGS